ncbi:DNA methylase [Pseudomonas savastanoi pv. nerii]|uniref:DNA methylase n=2 Tax=Pseudomonas TaxID=286 RepID=A0AB73RJG3_PSESS|nr:DNA methylase [Pseudomonas savastanoi pv. nerii]PAB37634.1 DNA methylase [Pseudomonas savastanoi]
MRYPGGKGKCYQRLINMMPPHQTFIETHLGAGAVMRNKRPATRNIGIDIDPDVHTMWQSPDLEHVCELITSDASSYLASYSFKGDELVYADPPYVTKTRRRSRIYRFEYDDDMHLHLLDTLLALPCKVMISGYDNALYNDKLVSWGKTAFMAKTHTDVREECVWMNYPVPHELHDTRYLGDTFRERQTIARRQARLKDRIESMHPVERTDFIRWLTETYGSTLEAV